LLVAAFVVPAILIWALLGLLVSLVPLSRVALAMIIGYAIYYGVAEAMRWPGLRPPGRKWQVPGQWVAGRSASWRILVWGFLLGPGFATRNPYAGFWVLPLAVAAVGSLRFGVALAATLGLLHASGRAAALLRDVRTAGPANYLNSVLWSMRWRAFDGLALLAVGAAAIGVLALRW
jgi:hypothetical protein